MATQYNIYSYIKGVNGFGLAASDTIYSAVLTSATEANVTVPSSSAQGAASPAYGPNKFIAVVNVNGPSVWMAVNKTATVAVGPTFAASDSRLVAPNAINGFYVRGGDVLHFISSDSDVEVSVAFYAIQEG